jgi:hypothetical protein
MITKTKYPKLQQVQLPLIHQHTEKTPTKKKRKKYPSHNKNKKKNKKSRPSNGLQLSSSPIKTLPQMHLFDTQIQDCFLFLLDDDDDGAGIVEKITDLLSSEGKKEQRATKFPRPNFLVHKNHRIQNIIISHTVFPPSFLSQTTAFHPTPAQTRYIFSSNTSPILSQTRYSFSSITHTNEDSYLNLHFGCLLLHSAFIPSFLPSFLHPG